MPLAAIVNTALAVLVDAADTVAVASTTVIALEDDDDDDVAVAAPSLTLVAADVLDADADAIVSSGP